MDRKDLLDTLFILNHKKYDEFDNYNHEIVLDYIERKYEVTCRKINGDFKAFTVTDIGPADKKSKDGD
jgi:hypothetical protein